MLQYFDQSNHPVLGTKSNYNNIAATANTKLYKNYTANKINDIEGKGTLLNCNYNKQKATLTTREAVNKLQQTKQTIPNKRNYNKQNKLHQTKETAPNNKNYTKQKKLHQTIETTPNKKNYNKQKKLHQTK